MSETISKLLSWGAHELKTIIPALDQRWFEVEHLLSFVMKRDRTWLIAHGEQRLSATRQKKFGSLIRRRAEHEPLAYLLGHASFYGCDFLVDQQALIPRPETELLVERALDNLKRQQNIRHVWDVGTGSGVIALTLAKEQPRLKILASDVSTASLSLAKKNAHRLKTKVKFVRANLLNAVIRSQLKKTESLLITANLPYLPLGDRPRLAREICHEPPQALFAKQGGLFLISRLLKQLSVFLRTPRPCVILLEFDPPQAKKLLRIAKKHFPRARVSTFQDLCGRDRVLELCFL